MHIEISMHQCYCKFSVKPQWNYQWTRSKKL